MSKKVKCCWTCVFNNNGKCMAKKLSERKDTIKRNSPCKIYQADVFDMDMSMRETKVCMKFEKNFDIQEFAGEEYLVNITEDEDDKCVPSNTYMFLIYLFYTHKENEILHEKIEKYEKIIQQNQRFERFLHNIYGNSVFRKLKRDFEIKEKSK